MLILSSANSNLLWDPFSTFFHFSYWPFQSLNFIFKIKYISFRYSVFETLSSHLSLSVATFSSPRYVYNGYFEVFVKFNIYTLSEVISAAHYVFFPCAWVTLFLCRFFVETAFKINVTPLDTDVPARGFYYLLINLFNNSVGLFAHSW